MSWFVVRNDEATADILYVLAEHTHYAYNLCTHPPAECKENEIRTGADEMLACFLVWQMAVSVLIGRLATLRAGRKHPSRRSTGPSAR